MNVHRWLEQVRRLDQLINAKLAEREKLLALATNITPKPMDGMPHSNTGTVSRTVEEAVVKLIALADEINRLVDKYVDYKQEVVDILETLPEKEYGVIHRHYIQYMTWEEVAEDMGYSTTQVWRLKKKAFRKLENVIECNVSK